MLRSAQISCRRPASERRERGYWHAVCRPLIVARVLLTLLIAALPVLPAQAQGAPPGPPPGLPDPAVAVPRHVLRVANHLGGVSASDDVGRRALSEAHISLSAAQAALAEKSFRAADELAASADDLIHVVNGPPPHARLRDPAEILPRVAFVDSVLATVTQRRVRELLAFANGVADGARTKAALGESDAGREAERAEAIARAAAHVAIAADSSLAPVLPAPKPRRPPPGDPI